MIDKELVRHLAEKYLEDSTIFLVDVEIRQGNNIIIEIDNEQGISIDDCIGLNKYIESQLDREIEDYELEVGSAGINQPFKILRQYAKNIGNEVEILAKSGKKMTGILKDANEKGITLAIDKQVKPEGSKKKITVTEDLVFLYDELKYTKYSIRFK